MVSTENQFYSSIVTLPSTTKLLKGLFRCSDFWLPLFAWLLTSLLRNWHLSQKIQQLRLLGSPFHLLCNALISPSITSYLSSKEVQLCSASLTRLPEASSGLCLWQLLSTYFSTFLPTTLTNQKCLKNKSRLNVALTLSSFPPLINPGPSSLSVLVAFQYLQTDYWVLFCFVFNLVFLIVLS